jgi:hypothetical protein
VETVRTCDVVAKRRTTPRRVIHQSAVAVVPPIIALNQDGRDTGMTG